MFDNYGSDQMETSFQIDEVKLRMEQKARQKPVCDVCGAEYDNPTECKDGVIRCNACSDLAVFGEIAPDADAIERAYTNHRPPL